MTSSLGSNVELTYAPDDTVLSCKYIESGLQFQLDGIYSCVLGTVMSPVLFDLNDIEEGKVAYPEIIERRKQLFKRLNDKDVSIKCHGCGEVVHKKFKDVRFDMLGGCVINIQHFTMCNLRCSYCCYNKQDRLIAPQYSVDKIFDVMQIFRDKGNVCENNNVTLSGGEPTLLKDLDVIIDKLAEVFPKKGEVTIFTNAIIYKDVIAKHLSTNTINICTSIDAGLPSTYRKMKQGNLHKAIETLVKYRNTGTQNIWLKYNITDENRDEDNLVGFMALMALLKPGIVLICPEYQYNSNTPIPYESVLFGAKLWHMIDKYCDSQVYIQSDDYVSDPKMVQYSADVRREYDILCGDEPITQDFKPNSSINVPTGYAGYLQTFYESYVINGSCENMKIAIWGFGNIGKAVWRYSDRIKNKIAVVIDTNASLHGTKPSGDASITIQPPEWLINNPVDAVIISTVLYSNEIFRYIKENIKYNIKVISPHLFCDLNERNMNGCCL